MSWFRKTKANDRAYVHVIPAGMADLHSHVLFGVDDGARTCDESLAMLDGLAALGFTHVAATPHFDMRRGTPSRENQDRIVREIAQARGDRGPQLHTGAECVLNEQFGDAATEGRIPNVGVGPAYLLELGFVPGSVPPGIEEFLFRQRVEGRILIAAHPERTPDLQRDPGRAESLRQAGLLFQMDVMALVGRYGREATRAATALLNRGAVDIVATDIHRPEDLVRVTEALDLFWDREPSEFVRLLSTNPLLVLEGRGDEIRGEDV